MKKGSVRTGNPDRVGPRSAVDAQLLREGGRERHPAGLEELGLADEQGASIQVDVANREPEGLTDAKPALLEDACYSLVDEWEFVEVPQELLEHCGGAKAGRDDCVR